MSDSDDDDKVTLCEKAKVLYVADKSVKFRTVEYGEQFIPKSQIHDDSEVHGKSKVGKVGKLVITSWLAEQRGWL